MDHELILRSLRRAVAASPDDRALRRHLARTLVEAGAGEEAIAHLSTLLAADASDSESAQLLERALAASIDSAADQPDDGAVDSAPTSADDGPTAPESGPRAAELASEPSPSAAEFDWAAAEAQVDGLVDPMFVGGDGDEPDTGAFDVERSGLTLADVGGMQHVKERLDAAFLAPMQNEELRRLYGKSLRGGLLLYGPPGCGKTFLARAVAGELGASFISAGVADILDQYLGTSERNLHELFELARRNAPCVVFLDELDALGVRRTQTRHSGMRNIVVQLLQELDSIGADNEGVFVLAATNQPWDIDPALRRPGRLDRTLLVLPPDQVAREAVFRVHLRDRPVESIDLAELARRSDGLTGADIAYVTELAAERALLDSVRSGTARMIGMPDLLAALREVRPSTGAWLDAARNVVLFGDDDGTFDELRGYLKKSKRL
ncbi:ATP-binding protein [Schumannella luteola]|uniref:SpoVK/Ycf46/Vps4 family AAA+-type ATPase n=1 Tax=Schumannella luteola TaxID=472059 RepID=A0A852YI72_9MICO|nr:AAA family ATPase [Schumannella luteola]NYG99607.1 SpoVK/Ycf46/Vps4 family AAA+-type ATPase [Schumannella luteola]TPX02008.1 AAA family ATPase [Schumannella luteola]